MINPELGYSDKTQELIERMCRNVERKDFTLHKKTASRLILETYDLFKLPRPKKVVWCKDIFDDRFQESAGSALSARSAGSAWSARSAWSAGSALSARSARSAGSAGSALSARSAGSARSAWSAWSARSAGSAGSALSARSAWSAGSAWSAWSAGSAGSALDYDFDWFVIEHEYCENPDEEKPNKNDRIYLKYCELLMQAKEAGLGYRVEWEDTLYLAPTPLVLIDEQNRFHSAEKPAIRWQEGNEFYFLYGVSFDEKLWKRVTGKRPRIKTILSIENMEQRMAALKTVGVERVIKGATLLDKSARGNELYLVENVFNEPALYLKYKCPSTGRVYVSGVDPSLERKADICMAWKFSMTADDYAKLEAEA